MALVKPSHRAVQPAPTRACCAKKLTIKNGSILVSKILMHLVLMNNDSNI